MGSIILYGVDVWLNHCRSKIYLRSASNNFTRLTGIANDVVGHIAQEEAPPIFWDVRMDLLNYPEHANTHGPTGERIENGMMFWEGVANERFVAEG